MSSKMSVAHRAAEKDYTHVDLASINSAGKWEIDFINLTNFFVQRGYFVYRVNINKFMLIRIIDNIVVQVGKKDLADEILGFLIASNEVKFMHQFFLRNMGKALSDDFLQTLPAKNVEFKKDRPNEMQIYYSNCIVRISPTGIKTYPYTSLNGYIWESQILSREYTPDKKLPESDFRTFIFNICNRDAERFYSLCSVIGFMLHNYKNPAKCPAIILNDEVISDNPEGGTGKGLIVKALKKFLSTVTIEGKTFTFDKNFVYQAVNGDTKLIAFQDVKRSFDFERLFSVITDGISVEKKGMAQVDYDFEDAPKILITTNYALRGMGNSHRRRRHEVEISQYYNGDRTPELEFNKMFFDGWDENEYLSFDYFMVDCCQHFLKNGLIAQKLINLPEKHVIVETNADFLEFMQTQQLVNVPKHELFGSFVAAYPAFDPNRNKFFSKQKFTSWLRVYADFKGFTMPETKHEYIKDSVRYYTFKPK